MPILSIIKHDRQEAVGVQQGCAGQIAGVEAAIHAMKTVFLNDNTEAIIYITCECQ